MSTTAPAMEPFSVLSAFFDYNVYIFNDFVAAMDRRIQQSLYEQFQVTELEINLRKRLFELSDLELERLHTYRRKIEPHVHDLIGEFYDLLIRDEYVPRLIGDSETFNRLKTGLHRYILDLFSGFYDSEYVNNRLRIGLVHKRIGVEPKYFLSAERFLIRCISNKLETIIENANERQSTINCVSKLIAFDTSWILDTYIGGLMDEMQDIKAKTDTYVKSLELKVESLTALANRDPLTELYNSRAFRDSLRKALLLSKQNRMSVSVVYLDVDDFKGINDNHGHQEGDRVLKHIGFLLSELPSESDIACRQGGDEFCLAMINCRAAKALKFVESLIEQFKKEFPKYSLSIGIAHHGEDGDNDVDALIHNADKKMYMAKKAAGFKVCA
ncbi:GGDEF domain-containing protein [Vibrio penaeicida]|uniref:GGDEF domain-containing protein n=1 Tax=Vibrio penaeicida TaxID=104609 RepID=UPI0027353C2C|nr:GGDEF domain-containing protein [Vibrio penaeicida]MDP2573658.1 GGDEF domain-containing protein [Vibrio penaeicida]